MGLGGEKAGKISLTSGFAYDLHGPVYMYILMCSYIHLYIMYKKEGTIISWYSNNDYC